MATRATMPAAFKLGFVVLWGSVLADNGPISARISIHKQVNFLQAAPRQSGAAALEVAQAQEKPQAVADVANLLVDGCKKLASGQQRDAALQESRSHEGMAESATWGYLKTSCLQKRQDWVMQRFHDTSCQKVLEIGGYLTPLPKTQVF